MYGKAYLIYIYLKLNLYLKYTYSYISFNFYLKYFLIFPTQTRYIPGDKIIYLGLFIIKN